MSMNLVPDSTATRDIGTSTKKWKDGHFSGTLYCKSFEPEDPVTNVSAAASAVTNTAAGNITATDQQSVNNYFDGIVGAGKHEKNLLINGEMLISQRASSFTITAGAAKKYTLDRWWVTSTGGNLTVTPKDSVTDLTGFTNSLLVTGGSGVTGNIIGQYLEKWYSRDLAGKKITLSMYVRASAVTSMAIEACVPTTTADDFSSKTITVEGSIIGITSSWQRKSITFDAPSGVGKGLGIMLVPDALSSGGTLEITGVQLEVGSKATDFMYKLINDLILDCYRYFQLQEVGMSYKAYSIGDTAFEMGYLDSMMRTIPTISLFANPVTQTNCDIAYAPMSATTSKFYIAITATATGTVSFAQGVLAFDAEL